MGETGENKEKQRETGKTGRSKGETGSIRENIEKHGKTGRIREKRRKTRKNKGKRRNNRGMHKITRENFYIYSGHIMESYMRE